MSLGCELIINSHSVTFLFCHMLFQRSMTFPNFCAQTLFAAAPFTEGGGCEVVLQQSLICTRANLRSFQAIASASCSTTHVVFASSFAIFGGHMMFARFVLPSRRLDVEQISGV